MYTVCFARALLFVMFKFACFFIQLTVNDKSQNLRRLQAQRNELNAKGIVCKLVSFIIINIMHNMLSWNMKMQWVLFWIVSLVVVRLLREELQLLQEQGSYVGEVVRAMDKKKVLVKVWWSLFSSYLSHVTINSEIVFYICVGTDLFLFYCRCIPKESLLWMWIRTLISMM